MSISGYLRTQPKWLLIAEALAMLGAIGYVDFATGWELSLFVFYAVPILGTAWWAGRSEAVALAIVGALVWWEANSSVHPYQTRWGYIIATFSRLAYFVFVAVGGAALKAQREADRHRIEALEKTRALEGEIVRVSEEEQRRIGRDLHDGLCQFLAAINFSARSLANDLETRGAERASDAREIEKLLKDAVCQARGLARGLFPVQMEGAGLSVVLDEMAATTQRLTAVKVSFTEDGDTRVPDCLVATQLYRIAQEAVSNAVKHSGSSQIDVSLRRDGDSLVLTIADDGKGFTPPAKDSGGMGLNTMNYRANSIGAQLTVDSGPKGGTIVCCRVRLDAPKEELISND